MNKNTLKAIKKRISNGETEFKIGRIIYYVNYDRKIILYYLNSAPQIVYFDEVLGN